MVQTAAERTGAGRRSDRRPVAVRSASRGGHLAGSWRGFAWSIAARGRPQPISAAGRISISSTPLRISAAGSRRSPSSPRRSTLSGSSRRWQITSPAASQTPPAFDTLWRLAHPARLPCMRRHTFDLLTPRTKTAWDKAAGKDRGARAQRGGRPPFCAGGSLLPRDPRPRRDRAGRQACPMSSTRCLPTTPPSSAPRPFSTSTISWSGRASSCASTMRSVARSGGVIATSSSTNSRIPTRSRRRSCFESPPRTARRDGRTAFCARALSSWSATPSRPSTASAGADVGSYARGAERHCAALARQHRPDHGELPLTAGDPDPHQPLFRRAALRPESARLRGARADARSAGPRSAVRRQDHDRCAARLRGRRRFATPRPKPSPISARG